MIGFFKRAIAFNEFKRTMTDAFPDELHDDVNAVLNLLRNKRHKGCDCLALYLSSDLLISKQFLEYKLFNEKNVKIPYRIYLSDAVPNISVLSPDQQLIYHCIFSRSCDGHVRQAHIEAILNGELRDWCLPFILTVSGEYVVEILDVVYDKLHRRNNDRLKEFCLLNFQAFLYVHARMISYWERYYRFEWYRYDQYIGKRLFAECFGYKKSMEKLRKEYKDKYTLGFF